MVRDKRKSEAPLSTPPMLEGIDSSWDEDSGLDLELDDEKFDRTTAIPAIPSAEFARQVFERAEEDEDMDSVPTRRGSDDEIPLVLSGYPPPPVAPAPAPQAGPRRRELELDLSGFAGSPLELADRTVSERPPSPSSNDLELELGAPAPQVVRGDPALQDMKDRYAMGDFSGALIMAEGILESNPHDEEAGRYAHSCRDVLTQMYSARLGALSQIVRVAIPQDQIRWLSLDHRAGFLLSLVDGNLSIEEILDVSGMSRLDALRIMYTLFDQRVIALLSAR
jgi:hypothetical protein